MENFTKTELNLLEEVLSNNITKLDKSISICYEQANTYALSHPNNNNRFEHNVQIGLNTKTFYNHYVSKQDTIKLLRLKVLNTISSID